MLPTVTKMISNPYKRRHQVQRFAGKADQVEYNSIKNGPTPVDVGFYTERVAGAMDDFEPDDPSITEDWKQSDLRNEDATGQIYQQISRRMELLKDSYPFELKNGTLKYKGHDKRSDSSPASIYEFLLAICTAESLTRADYVQLPRVFERVSTQLVAAYFGEHVRSIHIGSPRDSDVGRSFKEAMEYVSRHTGEWTWGPEDELPDDPGQGDAGCDFVVWPDTLDGRRIGQLFILGQCACGNNWGDKLYDLDLDELGKWFKPLSVVTPVRTFATPFHVTDALLREVSRKAGLFFDRARLTLLSKKHEKAISSNLLKKMDDLIELVFS